MKHEETYYGHRIVVTTTKNSGGRWTSKAELADPPPGATSAHEADADYDSEDEARKAALSKAAGAIDRGRTGKGKP
jgi:hypothetical protein